MPAKRTNRRKKKNPTTAQIVVLGIGGTIGVGLLGYGIYLAVKKPEPSLTPGPEGAVGMNRWEYQVIPNGPVFISRVWPPGGAAPITVAGGVPDYGAAIAAGISYIKARGGIPIPRGAA